MSAIEELDFGILGDEYDVAFLDEIEENWRKGFHIDQNGIKWNLKDMRYSHLLNTIKFFKEKCNISDLKKEINRRNKKLKINLKKNLWNKKNLKKK